MFVRHMLYMCSQRRETTVASTTEKMSNEKAYLGDGVYVEWLPTAEIKLTTRRSRLADTHPVKLISRDMNTERKMRQAMHLRCARQSGSVTRCVEGVYE